MRGRKEHLNTYLDQFKAANFCSTFSSVSTGIDSGFIFLLDMQLCAAKGKKFAGFGCSKINRNAGLTSPGENISAHISNKMAQSIFQVCVCFVRVQLESLCRCGGYTPHCSFSGCIFLEQKFIQDELELGGKQEIADNSGTISSDTYNIKGVDVC